MDDGSTLVAGSTKSSAEVNNQYSTEMSARPYPTYSAAALTGGRTFTLRIGRNLPNASTAFAVAADTVGNHFSLKVVPA